MNNKLIGTLVALTLILGSGCGLAMGGGAGGMMSHHGGMMGGAGTVMGPGSTTQDTGSMSGSQVGMSQQGMDQDSDSPSGQSQVESGHAHGVPNTYGTTSNPQSHQGHGGPPYCP
jgi:hypothetical protein